MLRTTCLAVLFVGGYLSTAYANCDSILSEKLLTTSEVKDEDQARFAFSQSFCNKSFQEMGSSDSFAVGVKYKVFAGSFNKSESSFNSWKTENCGAQSSDAATQRFRYAASQALSADAVAAWEQCNRDQNGLTCWMKPATNDSEVILNLNYRSKGTVTAKVWRSLISNGTNPAMNNSATLYDAGIDFGEGEDNIILERRDQTRDLSVTLTIVESTTARTSCTASAPVYKIPPAPPSKTKFKEKQEALLTKIKAINVSAAKPACVPFMTMVTNLKGGVAALDDVPDLANSASQIERQAYERSLFTLDIMSQDVDVAVQQLHQNGC